MVIWDGILRVTACQQEIWFTLDIEELIEMAYHLLTQTLALLAKFEIQSKTKLIIW